MSLTVTPDDALMDGCPVLAKGRAVIAQKGTNPDLIWPMRDAQGNPIDLSSYLCTPSEESEESETQGSFCGQVIFRFADAISPCEIQQVIGSLVSETEGKVKVELPDVLTCEPGIWQFQVAITDADGKIQEMNSGLLSVERGLFGDVKRLRGAPTIQELRMELRDTPLENSRLADFEFSDAEIVFALKKPLDQWNERPPPLTHFTSRNFPFSYNWRRAAVGELLATAAHYYRRNKTQMAAAGVTDQALDRDNPYEAKSAMIRQEWLEFVDHMKVTINAQMAYGDIGSGWYVG